MYFSQLRDEKADQRKTAAATIKLYMYMKRCIRKQGPPARRYGNLVRNALCMVATPAGDRSISKAEALVHYFLTDIGHLSKFRLRTKAFFNRVTNIQIKGRKYIHQQAEFENTLIDQLERGINNLRNFLILNKSNKRFSQQYPDFVQDINLIGDISKRKVCQRHKAISSYVHSYNLLRWYGVDRNNGKYNSDCIVSIIKQLTEMMSENDKLFEYIRLNYPTADML